MWELPEITVRHDEPIAIFRHSITDTDYEVAIHSAQEAMIQSLNGSGRWFSRKQWQRLALTGLTRKVLRKLAPAT
jgi:hypothetical protein